MRFHGAVVFHGDDVDDLLATALDIMAENEEREVSVRCSCTWRVAADDAGRQWQDGATPLLEQAKRRGIVKVARRRKLLGIARQVNELWQERMRTMVDHPAYGRAAPDCPYCHGAGRVDEVEYAKFDYHGEVLSGQWGAVLTRPCRVPRVWSWSDDLSLTFDLLCGDAGVPRLDLAEILPPGTLEAISPAATAALDERGGIASVSQLVELDVVPDTIALVDPAGRWFEREEVETAEDLASWHGRVAGVLREYPNANVAVVEFHT